MQSTQNKKVTQIQNTGVSFASNVDLGTLQRACPEIGHYFRYIKEKIRPSDGKWDRRVLNNYRNYYIRDDILWHIGNTRGRTHTVQEYMHQKAVMLI